MEKYQRYRHGYVFVYISVKNCRSRGNVQVTSPYSIIFWALFFSLSTAALIVFMAKRFDFSPASIILSGVAISSLFAAATMIVQYFAQDSMQVASVVFWTFGDLGRASWQGI